MVFKTIMATDVALLLGSKPFDMTGTRAVLEHLGLVVICLRTHTPRDPVRWTYRFVGDYQVHGGSHDKLEVSVHALGRRGPRP